MHSPLADDVGSHQSLTERAWGGFIWQFAGTGGRGILQIALLTVLARLITPAEFGIVSAAMIIVGVSAFFAEFGVGPALVQKAELIDSHIRQGFLLTLILSTAACILVWQSADLVANFFEMPELVSVLEVLSTLFVLRGLGVVAESLLQRNLEFRSLAVIDLISYGLGYGVVGISLAALGFGYWALVGAHMGQTLTQTMGLLHAKPHNILPDGSATASLDLIRYGGGHTVGKVWNYAALQADNLVVGRLLGATALGIYGRAYSLLTTPANLFGTVLDRVLFPSMSSIQNERDRLAMAYRRAVGSVALATLPVSAVVFVLAPEIVAVLLGNQWGGVVAPLRVLSFGIMFRTSYKISDSLVRATGHVYRRAWRQAVYAMLVLAGAAVGSQWGVSGVAIGVLFAITANFLLMASLVLNVTGVSAAEFFVAHAPGARVLLLTGPVAFVVVDVFRAWGLNSMVTLLAGLASVGSLAYLVAVRLWPHFFLGPEGQWLIETAKTNLPAGLKRLLE